MYCRECGQLISNESPKCTNCGTEKGLGDNYCYKCGSIIKKHDLECCEFCGADLNDNRYVARENVKSKLIAVFLALFLGGMGILYRWNNLDYCGNMGICRMYFNLY